MLHWFERDRGEKIQVRRRRGIAGQSKATVWAVVTQIPEYNVSGKNKYIVQKAAIDTDSESETYNEWVGDGSDIDIERAIGFEGYLDGDDDFCKDVRNWFPWFGVGAVVPIVERWDYEQTTPALRWFLDKTLIYGGPETDSSVRHSEDDGFVHTVWV